MTNIVVLNSQAHRGLRVQSHASGELGDAQHFVPVILKEFSLLAVQCPILFSKDSETGRFYAGALLGFDAGENLLLEGSGFVGYRPLDLQRRPFFTAGDDIAIDLDSPRISSDAGQALFNENGSVSSYLETIISTFQELKSGSDQTRTFVGAMLTHKLIEPVTLDLSFDDGVRRQTEGLYTINQEAVRALSDEAVLSLFRSGYLQLIYLVIASLKQVPALARRKNLRLLES